MYKITYVNKYDYLQEFTGIVVKNFPDRMIIDVSGSGYLREIFKEKIIIFEYLKNSGYERL